MNGSARWKPPILPKSSSPSRIMRSRAVPTISLARPRLGKKKDALAAFRDVRATGSEPPGALAVRALVLAENGYEEGARNDAHNLGAAQLLPEERALIAPLLYD